MTTTRGPLFTESGKPIPYPAETRPDPRCEVCGYPVIFESDHTPERHAAVLASA